MNWKQWVVISFVTGLTFLHMFTTQTFTAGAYTFAGAMFWMWLGKIFWAEEHQ